jgi:hypothetical protein
MATTTSITSAQLPALKASINANTDPTFVAFRNANNASEMANWYNVLISPPKYGWNPTYTSAAMQQVMSTAMLDVVALKVDNQSALQWFANIPSVDMGNANVRASIEDMCDVQTGLASLLTEAGKIAATRGENIYLTGTGSLADPGLLGFMGSITSNNIVDARALP